MGRKHKFVNKTHYPDWAIERFTRCIFDDVLAFFATEEGQREYALWEEEQARIKASSCPSKSKRSAAFGASNASCEQEQAEYEAWEREQEELKRQKKAAATKVAAASFCYRAFFLRGPLGFDSGRISQPLAKYVCS